MNVVPYLTREKNEPHDVKQNSECKKCSVGPSKALTVVLNCD